MKSSSAKGMLLSFEGIDGCGKSTQAELLREKLAAAGFRASLVREPGGTILSERVRDLLLERDLSIEPLAEMLLFSVARNQLVQERIRPALERGEIIVADRFYDSTIAYQGAGRQVADQEWLENFCLRVTGGLKPDRTYLIRLEPSIAASRRSGRDNDRMEETDDDFIIRVAEAYDGMAAAQPERFMVIDGNAPIGAIHEAIRVDAMALVATRIGTRLQRAGIPRPG